MAMVAMDAVFQALGTSAFIKHFQVMIRFEKVIVAILKNLQGLIIQIPSIRHVAEFLIANAD